MSLKAEMNYSETHKDIVEACKHQDRKAQYQLYELYSKAMYNICLRMLNDEEEAADILQNSFVDVFTKLDYFKYKSSIGAWIKRIVINNCINHLKKRRISWVSLEGTHNVPIESTQKENDSPYNIQEVKEAIQQLPDGYRLVLTLYLFEGYDHTEIAKILDISVSTSKSQYNRAKKKLRSIVLEKPVQ